ncbi:MAG: RNA polymerase sigma factor [Candidatus Falkowbacteria bacterium]
MEEFTDEQLVRAYIKGDNQAIEVLLGRYAGPMLFFVVQSINNQAEAEDLAQEILYKSWRKIKTYHPEQPFKPWLYRLARNTVIDYWRKRKLPLAFADADDTFAGEIDVVDESPLALTEIMKREEQEDIAALISTLAPDERMLLNLYYYQGLNLREIAELSQSSVDTIKSRHRRVLQKLRKLIDKIE